MTIFTVDPACPEAIEALKKTHQTLLEVTTKHYYVVDPGEDLEALAKDWFITHRHSAHAYRDGSHIGGADKVLEVRDLTNDGKTVFKP